MQGKSSAPAPSEKGYSETRNQLRDMDLRSSSAQVGLVVVLVGCSVGWYGGGGGEKCKG